MNKIEELYSAPSTTPTTENIKLLKITYNSDLGLWRLGASRYFHSILDVVEFISTQYGQDYRDVIAQIVGIKTWDCPFPDSLLKIYQDLPHWNRILELDE